MKWFGFKNVVKTVFAFGLCMPLLCRAQVLRTPVPNKLVVLSFDDAVVSHFRVVAPLLKKYGFGATFFVCEFKDPPFSDTSKYMSWEQIAQLNKMGFEIGNHTQNHTHVNKLDSTRFAAELQYIEDKCKAYNIPKPVSFAYPGYDTSPRAIGVLKAKGYKFARAGWDRVYNPTIDHPYLIPGITSLASNSATIYEDLKQARDGNIVILTIHGVPDTAHPWVNTPPEIFEAYLKYLHDNHYHVIAMRDLEKYINVDKALTITPVFKPNKPQ